jgi:hypothetical protein
MTGTKPHPIKPKKSKRILSVKDIYGAWHLILESKVVEGECKEVKGK